MTRNAGRSELNSVNTAESNPRRAVGCYGYDTLFRERLDVSAIKKTVVIMVVLTPSICFKVWVCLWRNHDPSL